MSESNNILQLHCGVGGVQPDSAGVCNKLINEMKGLNHSQPELSEGKNTHCVVNDLK